MNFESMLEPVQCTLSTIALDLKRYVLSHYHALRMGQTYKGDFTPIMCILLVVATFDHCYFIIMKKSGKWTDSEVNALSNGFFSQNTTFEELERRLSGWKHYKIYKDLLGMDEVFSKRSSWVDLFSRFRNEFVFNRTPVIEQRLKLYDDIKQYLKDVEVPDNCDERTFYITAFMNEIVDKLEALAFTTDLLSR
jgi:hypothetical protein